MGYYLMIKTIDQNGVKYLCKCMDNKDHIKYTGSGVFWKKILNKNSLYTISTEVLGHYETKQELSIAGQYYSDLYNVVNDKTWANCIPETGDGGATVTGKIYGYDPVTLKKKAFNSVEDIPVGWIKGNPSSGSSRVIHHGITGKIKRIKPNAEIPEGYIKGGVKGVYKYGPDKNTKVYNNGEVKVYLKDTDIIPEGFSHGTGKDGSTKNKIGCHNPLTLQKRYVNTVVDIPEGWIEGLFATTGKKIRTPYGIYSSINECMRNTGHGRDYIKNRIKENNGWEYFKDK